MCVFVDTCITSLLLCIWSPNAWVLFYSVEVSYRMTPSASWAPGVFGVQALSFFSLWHRCHVAWLYMLYRTRLIRTRITVCSVSFHMILPKFNILEIRPLHVLWSLKNQGVEWTKLKRVSCQKVRMWNDLPYTVIATGTLDGFRVESTGGCFLELCCFQFSVAHVLVGFAKAIHKQFCVSLLCLCCCF